MADPDVAAAALFAAAGAIGIGATRHLPVGSTMRMGPGYLPLLVSSLLVALAACLALRVVVRGAGDEVPSWSLGPVAAIVASLAAFAILIDPVGLVGATIALLAVSRLADRPFRPWETAAVAVGGATFSALVFVELLLLPIALWPA
ncbi:MAG: tripartite tricarboxylate transporter TctB family protein [Alphaproteobacteria bacterium]|nr:tripartite tricarboxylate transporter TctB family protein [Alphaproteobacteria bacterium]